MCLHGKHIHPILIKLSGGDRRSIGQADAVAAELIANPKLLPIVLKAMAKEDPLIRMRAADAIEKVTRIRPQLLKPHKRFLLKLLSEADQQEVRWHLAQIIPRMVLTPSQRLTVVDTLERDLTHVSRIVCVNAMQGLADLALQDRKLRSRAIDLIKRTTSTGTAAIRARGRKLLARLVTSSEL